MNTRKWYMVASMGSAVGLVSAFWQMMEKITLLKHTGTPLTCDLNSVFSCSNVLNSHQASIFGPPNSLICTVLFAALLMVGVIGWTGSAIAKQVRLVMQFFALFMVAFGTWFLWQSAYRIGSLCIFCIFCIAGLLLTNTALLRINASDLPIPKPYRDTLSRYMASGADYFVWAVYAVVLAAMLAFRFR